MSVLRRFRALRPPAELTAEIAAVPYDVMDSKEARALAAGKQRSYLHVTRPEIDLPEDTDLHDDVVYAKAAENFCRFLEQGWLLEDARPGLLDRATLGTPGKYTFCFAEYEADSPWEPLHVERGFAPNESTVTIYASNSLLGVYNQLAGDPEPLLLQFADALCNLASPNVLGFNENLVVMAGEHAQVIRQAGWSKRKVREFLVQHARRTVADFKRCGRLPGKVEPEDETTWRYVMEQPEDLILVRAGGMAGSWSACLPGWGKKWTRSITTPVAEPLLLEDRPNRRNARERHPGG